jgi:quercetin dioxygenase-like cupin family protein
MHRHPRDEVQVVVDGEAEFRVGTDGWIGGRPGTVQFLPRGDAHSVRVCSDRARLVPVSVGEPYDVFARKMARCFAEGAPLEAIAQAAARHGVDLA